MNWTKENFTISTDKTRLDVEYIHNFLKTSYWAENVPIEIIRKSIDGAICFGLFDGEQQVGFARVITDKATFAYLADVFVDEKVRGHKLGVWLIDVIMAHEDLQHLRRFMLATRDAHGLYEKFGFTKLNLPERWMQKANPNIYKKQD